jgi:hypothetical protein
MLKEITTAIMLAPTFASANCIPLESLKEQWNSIPTNRVFLGLSDKGVAVHIYENPDNGRWSFWFTRPSTPNQACLFDQGQGANSVHEEFTVPAGLMP